MAMPAPGMAPVTRGYPAGQGRAPGGLSGAARGAPFPGMHEDPGGTGSKLVRAGPAGRYNGGDRRPEVA